MTRITIAKGDGIGPEIMGAVLAMLEASGAGLEYDEIDVGEAVYRSGFDTGIRPEAWETLVRNKVFLKAPITTPQGGGMKSLNVCIRKTLGLFANIRPCVSYAPFVKTLHPKLDIVIIRENEEDLYAGIEYRQTRNMMQSLKLISRQGSERICRFAFEYARVHHRKKVTCLVKDNIMKLTDGLFHSVFKDVAKEYPDIQSDHLIVDIGMARVANRPESFDVLVTENLYGDIVSDVVAEITGSVGLAGSANIGHHVALFEAVHGSAPDIAGLGIANPSGLLLGAIQMLVYLGKGEVASRLHNAWLKTLEDGIHTGDIYTEDFSRSKVGTEAFTHAVIERLGQAPSTIPSVAYGNQAVQLKPTCFSTDETKTLVGVDVFFDYLGTGDQLAHSLMELSSDLTLREISSRGVEVWPSSSDHTQVGDHWKARFLAVNETATHNHIVALLSAIVGTGLDFIKTEHLYQFSGVKGYA